MGWGEAKDLIIGFLGSSFCIVIIRELQKLRESIEHLNEKLAVVIVRTDLHEKRIDRIEDKMNL